MKNTWSLPVHMLMAGLLFTISSFAQANVSGTWVIESKQQIAGPSYSNGLPKQITISIQNDSLFIETISVGARGQDVTGKYVFLVSGQPLTLNQGRKVIRTLKWNQEKTGFLLNTVFYQANFPDEKDFTRVESWEFSKDGTQLNIDKKSIETRSEDWQIKGVFKKK